MLFSAMAAASDGNLIKRMFYTGNGQSLISFIFGLALAFMFQKVCKGDKCIVFEAPKSEEIDGKVFEFEGSCYKYKIKNVRCASASA